MKIKQNFLFIIGLLAIYFFVVTSVSLRQVPYGSRDLKDIDKIVADLKVAKTHVDRIGILKTDSDFVFDFFAAIKKTKAVGKGGRAVGGNANSFPAVIENSISMTVGFINACGLNTPHTHPRAAEFFLSVNGTLGVGFVAENGARTVTNVLSKGQSIVYPKGSMHWEANLGCDTVMFVGSFNNEDPGVLQIAQNFFGISADVISATLGGLDPKKVESIKKYIPENIAQGLHECLIKCEMKKDYPYYEDYSVPKDDPYAPVSYSQYAQTDNDEPKPDEPQYDNDDEPQYDNDDEPQYDNNTDSSAGGYDY